MKPDGNMLENLRLQIKQFQLKQFYLRVAMRMRTFQQMLGDYHADRRTYCDETSRRFDYYSACCTAELN